MHMQAEIYGNRVVIKEDYGDLVKRGYGEEKEEGLVLSLYEALYLLELGKIDMGMTSGEFLKYCETKEENFYIKYVVFRDLRNRGYVVKTGFKFGTHFRVYPRGKKPGEAHTKYVVHVVTEEDRFEPCEIARMVRLAVSIRTELVIAFVDSENDITYYKISRIGI